jgi:hypothetical protein
VLAVYLAVALIYGVLSLPEDVALPSTDALPPGEYSLVIGLYTPDGHELLPVAGGPGQDDLVLLEVLMLGSH